MCPLPGPDLPPCPAFRGRCRKPGGARGVQPSSSRRRTGSCASAPTPRTEGDRALPKLQSDREVAVIYGMPRPPR